MRFVVDPIDGTRAFLRGIPTWSILVGLEAEGVPVVGVAFQPSAGDLFVGVRGDGVDANGRPCQVSEVARLEDAVISHGGLEQFWSNGIGHLLERLGEATYTQRGFGDFEGYKHLLLGRVDAVIDPGMQPWDICAPAVLVREAGGRLTTLDGEETVHGGSGLASNGLLHDELVALLKK
jgi:histidinol-phosphatase